MVSTRPPTSKSSCPFIIIIIIIVIIIIIIYKTTDKEQISISTWLGQGSRVKEYQNIVTWPFSKIGLKHLEKKALMY